MYYDYNTIIMLFFALDFIYCNEFNLFLLEGCSPVTLVLFWLLLHNQNIHVLSANNNVSKNIFNVKDTTCIHTNASTHLVIQQSI